MQDNDDDDKSNLMISLAPLSYIMHKASIEVQSKCDRSEKSVLNQAMVSQQG